MRYIVALLAFVIPGSSFAQSCNDWSSFEFWQTATAEVVTNCLRSVPVDVTPDFDKTALHYAASEASSGEIINILVAAGANVEARDLSGSAPIHYAAKNPNGEILLALIAAGADLEAEQEDGARALHLAAVNNAPFILVEMLNAGADVYAEDDDGKTAFDYAKRGQTDNSINNYLILRNAM